MSRLLRSCCMKDFIRRSRYLCKLVVPHHCYYPSCLCFHVYVCMYATKPLWMCDSLCSLVFGNLDWTLDAILTTLLFVIVLVTLSILSSCTTDVSRYRLWSACWNSVEGQGHNPSLFQDFHSDFSRSNFPSATTEQGFTISVSIWASNRIQKL